MKSLCLPAPPPAIKAQVVAVPEPNVAAGINTLIDMPAFSWCYGCSATSAAMMMGYYDNHRYTNMYSGPANGGVCPMNNDIYWGKGESPLSATHIGKDDRTLRGHVEDYWIAADNPGPDPYIVNGWTEHTQGDCTADFMGTSQSKFSNVDGATTFYYNADGSPLFDYIPSDPAKRDGCHGMKLFVASRGYTVTANFSQYIYGYNGKTLGFTYANFKTEIDAGRPVMIQVAGHTMVGYGYNDSGSIIYIHDTWDNSNHQMPWGGTYSDMQHYGVTVLRLRAVDAPATQTFNDYDGDGKSDLALFHNGNWSIYLMGSGGVLTPAYGESGWTNTVSGDYDGDGVSDLALFRDGNWSISLMAGGAISGSFGLPGWTPVSGDYDGDHKSDLALFHNGNWSIYLMGSGNVVSGSFGSPGWTPVR